MTVTVVEGFAVCLTQGCDQRGGYRPIELELSRTSERATNIPVEISANDHVHPVKDSDIVCPDCDQPCAVMREKAKPYPKMV